MVLQSLLEFAQHAQQDEELIEYFVPLKCGFQTIYADIFLSTNGDAPEFFPISADDKKKQIKKWGPYVSMTSGYNPQIGLFRLCDLFGIGSSDFSTDKKLAAKSEKLLNFMKQCFEITSFPEFKIVADFMEKAKEPSDWLDRIKKAVKDNDMSVKSYVDVQIDGRLWFQEENIVSFWQNTGFYLSLKKENTSKKKKESDLIQKGMCLVCGKENSNLVRVFNINFSGFHGTNSAKISSCNCAAFCSRGLLQSYNSPVCESCADLIPKAWNYLINHPSHHFNINNQLYVFWGDLNNGGNEFLDPNKNSDPDHWLDFISSGRHNREQFKPEDKTFHMIGLGNHVSKIYVLAAIKEEDNEEGSDISNSLLNWAKWQRVLGDEQKRFFSANLLVRSLRPRSDTYKKKVTTLEYNLTKNLLMVSLGKEKISAYLMNKVLHRLSVDLEDKYTALDRLVLLNIALQSNNPKEVSNLNDLEPDELQAYNAGKIFNLLVYGQRKAIGETGKNMLNSYAPSVCRTPESTMSRLIIKWHNVYQPKLQRDSIGTAIYINKEIHRLLSMTKLPKRNTPTQQAYFWYGFHGLFDTKNTNEGAIEND